MEKLKFFSSILLGSIIYFKWGNIAFVYFSKQYEIRKLILFFFFIANDKIIMDVIILFSESNPKG